MPDKKIDLLGFVLLFIFFTFLIYAGFLSYKSIDFKILKKLEAQPLLVPPQPTSTSSANTIPGN